VTNVSARPVARPPWTIPPGRMLSIRAGFVQSILPVVVPVETVMPWPALNTTPSGVAIAFDGVAVLLALYGIAIIATARHPRRFAPAWVRHSHSSAPGVLFGTAWVLPVLLARGAPLVLPHASWAVLFWLPGVAIVLWTVLYIAARVASDRGAQRAIRAGAAPAYIVSSDHLWWWDADHWVPLREAAPSAAFESPDGNYWWGDERWLPMPPLAAKASLEDRGDRSFAQ